MVDGPNEHGHALALDEELCRKVGVDHVPTLHREAALGTLLLTEQVFSRARPVQESHLLRELEDALCSQLRRASFRDTLATQCFGCWRATLGWWWRRG